MVKQLYFHPPHSLTTPSPMARSALTLTRQQPRVRKTVFVRSHYRHRPGTAPPPPPPPPPPPSLPHGPLPPIPPLVGGRVIVARRRRGVFVEVHYRGKSRLVVVPAGRNGRFRMRQYELIDLTKD